MKTVIHTTIDGYDVVLGFSDPQMDPVATEQKVGPLVQALPEVAQAQSLGQELAQAQAAMRYAADQLAQARAQGNQIAIASQQQAYAQASANCDDIQAKLAPVLQAIDAKKRDLQAANPVWFTPGSAVGPDGGTVYESLMPETAAEDAALHGGKATGVTAATLKAAMVDDAHKQLCMDASTVYDYRGVVVWSNASGTWASRIISKLGDAPSGGEIPEDELTPDQQSAVAAQVEANRVAKLSSTVKIAEATAAQSAAKSAVASIQSEVTAGISTQDRLTQAVANYKIVLAGINAKYGLTGSSALT